MFNDLLNGVNINGILPVAVVACVYVGLILFATRNYWINNKEDTLKNYSIVFLAIFMMLPRIKPYDFIMVAIPVYFLCKDLSDRMKCLLFAVISLPLFFWLLNFVVYTTGFPFLAGVYPRRPA